MVKMHACKLKPGLFLTAATQEAEYAARLLAALGLQTEKVTG